LPVFRWTRSPNTVSSTSRHVQMSQDIMIITNRRSYVGSFLTLCFSSHPQTDGLNTPDSGQNYLALRALVHLIHEQWHWTSRQRFTAISCHLPTSRRTLWKRFGGKVHRLKSCRSWLQFGVGETAGTLDNTQVLYKTAWLTLNAGQHTTLPSPPLPPCCVLQSLSSLKSPKFRAILYLLLTLLNYEVTERCGWNFSTPTRYVRSPGFKSRPLNRLSWPRGFAVSLSSTQMPELCFETGIGHFLSHHHSRRYITCASDAASLNNPRTNQ